MMKPLENAKDEELLACLLNKNNNKKDALRLCRKLLKQHKGLYNLLHTSINNHSKLQPGYHNPYLNIQAAFVLYQRYLTKKFRRQNIFKKKTRSLII